MKKPRRIFHFNSSIHISTTYRSVAKLSIIALISVFLSSGNSCLKLWKTLFHGHILNAPILPKDLLCVLLHNFLYQHFSCHTSKKDNNINSFYLTCARLIVIIIATINVFALHFLFIYRRNIE